MLTNKRKTSDYPQTQQDNQLHPPFSINGNGLISPNLIDYFFLILSKRLSKYILFKKTLNLEISAS